MTDIHTDGTDFKTSTADSVGNIVSNSNLLCIYHPESSSLRGIWTLSFLTTLWIILTLTNIICRAYDEQFTERTRFSNKHSEISVRNLFFLVNKCSSGALIPFLNHLHIHIKHNKSVTFLWNKNAEFSKTKCLLWLNYYHGQFDDRWT